MCICLYRLVLNMRSKSQKMGKNATMTVKVRGLLPKSPLASGNSGQADDLKVDPLDSDDDM